jgi:3-amino-4-hydroxybenzoic acid synthase
MDIPFSPAEHRRFAWLDIRSTPAALVEHLVAVAERHGYEAVVANHDQLGSIPRGLRRVGPPGSDEPTAFDLVAVDAETSTPREQQRAAWVRVTDAPTLQLAVKECPRASYLIVEFADDTKIPLELVLAEAHGHEVRVVTRVADEREALVVAGVLERGSHGLLYAGQDLNELIAIAELVRGEREPDAEALQIFRVTETKHVGMGDRVCVDTCSYLGQDEGLLVGCFARAGLLIASETHHLPYMPLRPFRVNAGSLHSYVLGPRGRTLYLSELKCGHKVVAVRTTGETRIVTVGRAKIERRPLISVTAQNADGEVATVVLQEDWHVRMLAPSGVRNVTLLRPGDELFGYIAPGARHVGIPVDESIREQ